MANLEFPVNHDRTHRQGHQPRPIVLGQRFEHPVRRGSRGRMKPVGLAESERDLVVIAADDRLRLEFANHLNHRVRIGTVADDVAEDEAVVVAPHPCVLQARAESLEVGVNVRQNQIAHQASSQ